MQKIQELCRVFAMAARTQLTTTHAQLNKQLRMNDFLTISIFSERRVFLKNHYIEFHKNLEGRNFRQIVEILNSPVVPQQGIAGNPSVKMLF